MAEEKQASSPSVRVSYDVTQAIFASQYVVTTGADEMIINFSSGHITDPATGSSVLPIHTRIALSNQGARRLIATLQKALQQGAEMNGGENSERQSPHARFPSPPTVSHD